MRKITLILVLLSALLHAEFAPKESAVFVGIDFQVMNNSSKYLLATSGTIIYPFDNNEQQIVPTLKVGYRYFSLRSYLSYYYERQEYEAYTLKNHSLSANVEYAPHIYKNDEMNLFLLIGLGLGYLDTQMLAQNSTILSNHNGLGLELSNNFHQQNFNYGPNIGLELEIEHSVSFEIGFRYRDTDVIENANESSEENIQDIKKQVYVGLNYLF